MGHRFPRRLLVPERSQIPSGTGRKKTLISESPPSTESDLGLPTDPLNLLEDLSDFQDDF